MRKDVDAIKVEDVELRIEMLGGFTIHANGTCITKQVRRSSKIWKLIQYLVVHRDKIVPQDELIDVFCKDEYASNPKSALRTMVYRARSALMGSGLACGEDMIVSIGGGYKWNDAAKCSVDAEQFESLLKRAGASNDREERLLFILEAANLYHGDFLPNSAGELWVIPIERWYRTAFINNIYDALEILMDSGRDEKAEELCIKALRTDPFDEKILECHLRALLAQGKNTEALDEYRKMEAMFYDVLGVTFSETLRALYERIQRPEIKDSMSLENVLSEWLTDADFPGAYYCDVNILKSVFQIEARSAARSGRTAYIVRLDTKYEIGSSEDSVMKQLGQVIPANLRKGDLFTRSAANQYMLMLNSLTFDNCKMLADRIINMLDSKNQRKITRTSIIPVKPL